MSLDHPVIVTDLGAATHGDNLVRGLSVRDDLFGRETRWSLLSRFVQGPDLDRDDAALLDDVLVAIVAPDPRIWPLKVGWIIGAYGDWWAAGAAVQAMLAECRMGPWACAAAYETATALAALRGDDATDFEKRAVAWIRDQWDVGTVVWGFGVAGGAGRARDERMDLIDAAARRHGRDQHRHYRASLDAAAAIQAATGRAPNMALAVASLALDLGLTRAQFEALMYQVVEPQVLGNAYESARLRSPALRELPLGYVRYVGASHRRSPAALRSDGGAGG
ncbi:MAG: hypothetical protein H6719_01550 [Sandaracinaceae bacterium]|nr:hypothetical protein [Myxococcales bacterium]MCB9591390.1 hypothetical protein [Sandaracinaceae bacterium]